MAKSPKIIADPEVVDEGRTGTLSRLTAAAITERLGFPPNRKDDPQKVTASWGFRVGRKPCAVWDYYGSGKAGSFSCWGPSEALQAVFGDHYTAGR